MERDTETYDYDSPQCDLCKSPINEDNGGIVYEGSKKLQICECCNVQCLDCGRYLSQDWIREEIDNEVHCETCLNIIKAINRADGFILEEITVRPIQLRGL